MRRVPGDVASRLERKVQTRANGAAPELDLWITRPTTAMATNRFLERQAVSVGEGVTDVSVAVCHPRAGVGSSRTYLAYVQGGTAKVAYAAAKTRMDAHAWIDSGFTAPASNLAIAFDGTMPRDTAGRVEFVTEQYPWVFWVDGGTLYAQKLGTGKTVILAESNCAGVSAIRAMWSEVGDFDFGLVAFFILSGALYYRQLVGGVWQDAVPVSYGPSGVMWAEVAAFRTWDYRVGVQARATTGEIYELFTQYAGVGKQNTEHLEIAHVGAKGGLTAIEYTDTRLHEHVEVSRVDAGALYGGLYSIEAPVLVSARNAGDGSSDWGKVLVVTADVHLERESIAANAPAWTITDERGAVFTASTAEVGPDGKTVTLTFADFNAASGACRAAYTPGTAATMAGVDVETMEIGFTPEHLVPPLVDPPVLESVQNDDPEGIYLTLRFDLPLLGDPALCPPAAFTVTVPEFNYVPEGLLESVVKPVEEVRAVAGDPAALRLKLPQGRGSIRNASGAVTVAYAGGTLVGLGGAVAAFTEAFTPTGLVPKPDQNNAEHIEISVEAAGTLTQVYFTDVQGGGEHIEIAGIEATGTLTHIDDI